MPTELSHRHQTLIMNGERVTGLASDDPPVDLPQIALIEEDFGNDGTMYGMGTAMRGGDVVVKLQPSSPQVKSWMRKFAEIQAGARILWNGVYGDSSLGYSTLLRGGFLKQARPGITPGQTAEFTFVFEECIPQFDNARFAPIPEPAAAFQVQGDVGFGD